MQYYHILWEWTNDPDHYDLDTCNFDDLKRAMDNINNIVDVQVDDTDGTNGGDIWFTATFQDGFTYGFVAPHIADPSFLYEKDIPEVIDYIKDVSEIS